MKVWKIAYTPGIITFIVILPAHAVLLLSFSRRDRKESALHCSINSITGQLFPSMCFKFSDSIVNSCNCFVIVSVLCDRKRGLM